MKELHGRLVENNPTYAMKCIRGNGYVLTAIRRLLGRNLAAAPVG
jgi:hypothetical protein